MRAQLWLVGFLCALGLSAHAAAARTPGGLPELARHDTAVGAFTQRRQLPELDRAIESSGRFAYSRERGLVWQVREPVESRLVITDAGIYQDGEPVSASGAMRAVEPIFRGLFGGEVDGLRRHFRVETANTDEASTGEASRWRLRLAPESDPLARAIARVELAGAAEPASLLLVGADGGRTAITFRDIRHPERLAAPLRQALARAQ
jgi:hypothetical protein